MTMPRLMTSLKLGVALFALCVIIVPMTVGGVFFVSYHEKATLSDIRKENMRLADSIGGTVAGFLEAPLNTLSAVSRFSVNPSLSTSDVDALLEQLATSYGFFESIMVLDKRGIVRNIGVGPGISMNRNDHVGVDLSGIETIRKARSSGRHCWSNTFISVITGEPTLSLALPFGAGVVVGNVSLKDLSRIVAGYNNGKEHSYVVSNVGRIIACNTHRDNVQQHDNVSTIPSVAAGLAGKSGVFQYEVEGAKVFGAVNIVAETGWLVVVERSQNEVFAHLKAMERSLVYALITCLLLVFLLLFFVSRRVIGPVAAISMATRELAAGAYPQLPPYSGNFSELKELTGNFNEMSSALKIREAELQNSNNEMEEQIKERIKIEEQLREKNKEMAVIEEELRNQLNETLAAQGERDQLAQQVIQQQKLEGIGLLAGGIAHDFNNLLSPVFIYTEMVRKKLDPAEQSYSRLGTVLEAAGKAKDLVKQLLSFSSKRLLTSQLHDLNDITSQFVSMLQRTIRENIQLDVSLCRGRCPIMGDKTQIEQILLNLAVNAQDAISGNGSIAIETGHIILDNEYCNIHLGAIPGRYVMLAFSDTGCGIDDVTLNRVFEPFFTTKPVGHGTGLGLSTVYGIVKQHGGHVSILSKPGVGTTFQIYFPESKLEAANTVDNTVSGEFSLSKPAGTILLVEDNDMVREMTADLLESHNFKVLSAEHPQAAIAMFNEHKSEIKLLLSDVVMPHMTGLELYEVLVVQAPELKVIFMSGYASNLNVHSGSLTEVVNFLAKPFTSEALVKKVCESMGSTDAGLAGDRAKE